LDYNDWYKASGDWYYWGGSAGDTVAGWRTASSQGANDLNAGPYSPTQGVETLRFRRKVHA